MTTHVIDADAMARFVVGKSVNDKDRHGEPIIGRVVEVKQGNNVAIVITEPAGSGKQTTEIEK